MRDTQKQRVYDWQSALFESVQDSVPDVFVELPLEVAQTFVNKICTAFDITPPRVVLHKYTHGATAHYRSFEHIITLPKGWAINPHTIAHETAHAVVRVRYGHGVAAHGMEFVRMYALIIVRFLGVDALVVEQSIRKAKLKALDHTPLLPRGTQDA